jgi:hypothetical protein
MAHKLKFAFPALAATLAFQVACGGSAPPPAPATRSPTRDYKEPARGPDGEVLGANQQAPGDWIEGELTNEHEAYQPGGHDPATSASAPQARPSSK